MKNILVSIFIFSFVQISASQDTIPVFKRANSFLLGLSPSVRPVLLSSENEYVLQVGGSARVGYFLVPKLAIITEYSRLALISNVIDKQEVSTASLFGRYYWSGNRSGVYTNLGYTVSDSRLLKATNNQVKQFPSHYIALGGGLSIKVAQNIYLDVSYSGAVSLNGKDTRSYLSNSIGIDYIFNQKYKDTYKLKRNKDDSTQKSEVKRKFQVAVGAFYFPFAEDDINDSFKEFLLTSKFGYYLTKNITAGLITGFIYNRPAVQNDRFFYFVGPYINYKIIPHEKLSVYLETGYNYSNHSIPEVRCAEKFYDALR